jgi:hypothetical protein
MIAKMSPRPFARGSGVSSLACPRRGRDASTVAAPAAIRTPRRRGARARRARGAVRRDWDAIADGTG